MCCGGISFDMNIKYCQEIITNPIKSIKLSWSGIIAMPCSLLLIKARIWRGDYHHQEKIGLKKSLIKTHECASQSIGLIPKSKKLRESPSDYPLQTT